MYVIVHKKTQTSAMAMITIKQSSFFRSFFVISHHFELYKDQRSAIGTNLTTNVYFCGWNVAKKSVMET